MPMLQPIIFISDSPGNVGNVQTIVQVFDAQLGLSAAVISLGKKLYSHCLSPAPSCQTGNILYCM